MRANARNFELSEFHKIASRCHDSGAKAYLTLNSIVYDTELDAVRRIVDAAKQANLDAIIAWDPAILMCAKNYGMPFHISTQASISNFEALRFYAELGAECAVLARECSLEQVQTIKAKAVNEGLGIKIECFCHGAMCVAISGRCLTSQFLHQKSANRGDCLQPCRRSYKATDLVNGNELKVGHNYLLSPKDLCTLNILDRIISAGVDVLKIEGRSRSPEYVSTVTSAYRRAINAHAKKQLDGALKRELIQELENVYNRGFHTGFYLGTPTADDYTALEGGAARKQKRFVGKIVNVYNRIQVYEFEINAIGLKVGDAVLITGKTTGALETTVKSIHNDQNQSVQMANKGERVGITLDCQEKARTGDKVFLYQAVT